MILNGNQRGGGLKLAAHLTNDVENDHVEVYAIRGFISNSLRGALQEAEAVAKGTKCRQYLFSLSLNPPASERVSTDVFEDTIEAAEKKLGLTGQPRAIVFHEKQGRRHAHVVWSRIDARSMTAINLPYTRFRLRELSKDLFLAHGWRLPDGLKDRGNRDPRNFDLAEWQQAKRAGKTARDIKRVFQEAWQVSDTGAAFAQALEEKGYSLAKGDRGRTVAVDAVGEVYAVPKWTGLKAKEVRAKLGDLKALPSVDETKAEIANGMETALARWRKELAEKARARRAREEAGRRALIEQQRRERAKLKARIDARSRAEALARQARFRKGLGGVWDRLRGAHARIRRENDQAAWEAHLREQRATDHLIFRHLDARQDLARQQRQDRTPLRGEIRDLAQDRQQFQEMRAKRLGRARDGPEP